MIYLGADHGGFVLKEQIKNWLTEWNFEFQDLGAKKLDSQDDYPDFAKLVATKVAKEAGSFGILACRSGEGEAITANKIKGIRAVVVWEPKIAAASRNDDDANVLCLPADYIASDEAKETIHVFLTTPFANEERFERRKGKIKDIEDDL